MLCTIWDQKQKYVFKYYFVRGKSARDGRHKAGRAAFGLSCVARFEQLAGVFASCGALHYAKILANLKYTIACRRWIWRHLAQSGQSSHLSDKQTVQWTFAAISLLQQDSCVVHF